MFSQRLHVFHHCHVTYSSFQSSPVARLHVSKQEEKASLADSDLNVEIGCVSCMQNTLTPLIHLYYDADLTANAPGRFDVIQQFLQQC